jgi:thiol:disulfide interchange protein DsbD
MMKRASLFLILLWPLFAFAQGDSTSLPPISWTATSVMVDDGAYEIQFKGDLQPGFVIYSQHIDTSIIGPLPSLFTFDTIQGIALGGAIAENGKEVDEHPDPIWDNAVIKKFKGWVTFTVAATSQLPSPVLTGSLDFMTCDDMGCTPDRLFFRAALAEGRVELGTVSFLDTAGASGTQPTEDCRAYVMPHVDLKAPVVNCAGTSDEPVTGSLWKIFLLGFIGGLLALVTPCMFPMIPLTVSFFTKGSEDKRKGRMNAFLYGAFIVLIYLSFSLPFHLLGSVDPEIFNVISTNPWLNLTFFAIFIVFAISFFGYFEITLPSGFVNKMDQNASRFGGAIGIFFMAFTLALVSFSCTGPILGSLLVGAITPDSGPTQLTIGIGGFGLAIALPFALFAMFPGWLNSLPRSGSWLTSVKVVLGFIEVALAFKFYSTADMVSHWNTMPYEVFLAIWLICAVGAMLYLLGFIRFPHDSPVKDRSPVRWGFIALFAAISIYLALGFRVDSRTRMFAEPSLLSGLAPPASYSWIHPTEGHLTDLCEAMELSRRTGKPLMIDFTGYGCVNCRKMEQFVWTAPGVQETIDQEYVLVSLYVDDRAKLPKEEQHRYTTSLGKQKDILTIGDRWATLEAETFQKVSQPWYALVSPDGQLLNAPVGTSSVDEFKAFLACGLDGMKKVNGGVAK